MNESIIIPSEIEQDDPSLLSQLLSMVLSGSLVFDLIKIALLAYLVIIAILAFFNRKGQIKSKSSNPNYRERLYNRFIQSNLEVMRDLDQEEIKLMQETFENTVKNAGKPQYIRESKDNKSKSKRVSFNEAIQFD